MNEKMLHKFAAICIKRLQSIEDLIMKLESSALLKDDRVILMRELHTLKGESRILNLVAMSELTHVIEEALAWQQELGSIPSSMFFDVLYAGLDSIRDICNAGLVAPAPERIEAIQLAQDALETWMRQDAPSEFGDTTAQDTEEKNSSHIADTIASIITRLESAKIEPLHDKETQELQEYAHSIYTRSPTDFAQVAKELETIVTWAAGHLFMVEDSIVDILIDGFELIDALFAQQIPNPRQVVATFLSHMEEWKTTQADFQSALSEQHENRPETVPPSPPPLSTSPDSSQLSETEEPKTERTLRSKPSDSSPSQQHYLQIEVEQIEALTKISGELNLSHSHIEKLTKDLERLALDWMRLSSEEILLIKRSHKTNGDPQQLNKWITMQALSKEFSTQLSQLRDGLLLNQGNVDEFQHRISHIRLQKIGELFQRFPRAIRQLAKEQNKQIQVLLRGTNVSIDKTIIESLFDPLLHLIRNSVDHGIETPEERRTLGKPEKGTIELSAKRKGDSVIITISDDGGGIDPQRIQDSLIEKQLLLPAEIDNLSKQQLIQQLFRPGFSTRKFADHISGRGVGLDVVKATVEQLGGSIAVDSTLSQGTSFILTLPISIALSQALIVRIQEGHYAFPIQAVEEILIIDRNEIISVGEGEGIRLGDGSIVSVFGLGSLLEFGELESSNREETIVLIRAAGSRIGVRVDVVQEVRQLVQSNIARFIQGHRIISGTALIEGNLIVQFLNIMHIFELAQDHGARARAVRTNTTSERITILIAEDSDLTREMLVSRISKMNFIVYEAVNGQDCWDQLQYRKIDILMTDLDMPIMNGFELIRKVRSTQKTQHLPIVVLSTRRTKESKQQAAQAGADAYVVKSAYNETELLSTFQRLLEDKDIRKR